MGYYGAINKSELDKTNNGNKFSKKVIMYMLAFCASAFVLLLTASSNLGLNNTTSLERTELPHIIFVLVDDMGYGDMGYSAKDDMQYAMPFLTELSERSVKLTHYYTQHLCTPSRASFMTGTYVTTNGMYLDVIHPTSAFGLPLHLKTLPEMLKDYGYINRMVGKWHLGHYMTDYFPINRGFHSYYGFLADEQYYFSHTNPLACYNSTDGINGCYYDFYSGGDIEKAAHGTCSTHLFRDHSIKLIKEHDQTDPLFLFLSWQNIHSPLDEFPDSYFTDDQLETLDLFKLESRKKVAKLTMSLDDAMRDIYKTLDEVGMLDNTVIMVSGDNGGCYSAGGSNLPLRGYKKTLFEGGIRNNAYIFSPTFENILGGTKYTQLFHISDWLPTIIEGIVGGEVPKTSYTVDGLNHWETIMQRVNETVRDEIVHHITLQYLSGGKAYDYDEGNSLFAVRKGNYKLMRSTPESISWEKVIAGDAECLSSTDPGLIMFFDIKNDPYETTNLYQNGHIAEGYESAFYDCWDLYFKHEATIEKAAYGDKETKALKAFIANDYCIVPWGN